LLPAVLFSERKNCSLVGWRAGALDVTLEAGEKMRVRTEALCVCCFAAGGLEGGEKSWFGAGWQTTEVLCSGYRFHAWPYVKSHDGKKVLMKKAHRGGRICE
jgi:hypothetical protein